MILTVLDACFSHDFSLEFTKNNTLIDFGFFLEGSFINTVDTLAQGSVELKNGAGEFGFGCVPNMCGSVRFPAKRKIRIMHIHVHPFTLRTLLGRDMEQVTPCLLKVLENKRCSGFVRQHRQPPMVQAVANELFYGVKNSADFRMYIEGKAMELLALSLAVPSNAGPRTALCPKLRDILHAIREELEERHAAPPTLSELSDQYHLPIANMQAGFKTLFGMSVFAFIKEYRLQRAKKFFAEGNMNVSEVAWNIGYTNLSHFSAAYKKRFGVLPKAYLKALREHLHTSSGQRR
ncbi:AraC family transcriptional regulator [Pseudodesulfovibrio sp. S3]|nr:AraC family transcriptional regulator [Pseudodesulfovibrio sp. S3]